MNEQINWHALKQQADIRSVTRHENESGWVNQDIYDAEVG